MEGRKERINNCRENLSFLSFRMHANERGSFRVGFAEGRERRVLSVTLK